ncbi:MAG TPA: ComF family protein [Chitinophagaceae bacterium]|nr:ComF family protein [Chitinophagaceae bacterium]
MKKTATSIWNGLIDFVYPRLCLGCNKSLLHQEKVLCIECTELLPQTNYHHIRDNATFQRLEGRINIDCATSFGYYTKGGLLQYLVQELKYKGNRSVGVFLGQKMHAALKNVDWVNAAELIVPVPLHRQKQKLRGFNQSALLGQGIASGLGLPFHTDNLVRIVDTDTQTAKSRAQRVENMKNAFAVKDRTAFANRHILLVDDVLTTGATIERCALSLQEAGVAKISVVTVGIAV